MYLRAFECSLRAAKILGVLVMIPATLIVPGYWVATRTARAAAA
jgi:hypothetical protein